MPYPVNIPRLLNTAQAGPLTRWFFWVITVIFVVAALITLGTVTAAPLFTLSDFWRQIVSYALIASVVLELIGILVLAVKILFNLDRHTK